MRDYIVRFSVRQRIEHLVTMLVFTALCVTGFPQKFFTAGWAQALVDVMGGIDRVRWFHRACGFALAASTIYHFAAALWTIAEKKTRLTMVPNRKDFEDAIATLRYYLGLADHGPQYDRYDYKQKFEYWGLVAGNVIMIATGLCLIYPTSVAQLLPGQLIPAARLAHTNEGLMAFLVITIWHIYNAHLNPDVFPFDTSIFTGKISRERMLHEHPVELARLEGKEVPDHGPASTHARREVA